MRKDTPSSSCSSLNKASTSRLVTGSSAPVGSSAKISRGSVMRARAMATRCCSPPESIIGRAMARWPICSRSSRSSALRLATRERTPWLMSGCATLSRALRSLSRLPSWKMKETVCWRSLTSSWPVRRVMLRPSRRTEPALGFIRPPRHFMSVDFPEPEGPTTATASPLRMAMFRPRRATTLPSSAFDS